jgi:hypothetical protein
VKLFINDSGDESVGLWPISLELIFDDCAIDTLVEFRENFRKDAVELFKNNFDPVGQITATFSDECCHCGKLKKNCKCE